MDIVSVVVPLGRFTRPLPERSRWTRDAGTGRPMRSYRRRDGRVAVGARMARSCTESRRFVTVPAMTEYRDGMRTANTTLRAVRMGLLMSQDDFARAIRAAGARAGEPNDANKRLVQRWESGDIASPR